MNTLLGRRSSARRTAKKVKKSAAKDTKPRITQKRSGARSSSSGRSGSRKTAMKNDGVDVRSTADMSKLTDLIKNNKIVLILVYADWCGHCQTFKQDVWKNLSAMPNRKVPLAAVNEQVLAESPVANAKIDGYPSVLMMGQDMKPATFKDEAGNVTNAMPNTRDLEAMKTIVGADANTMLENADEEDAPPRSVESTPSASEKLNNAAEEAIENLEATAEPATSANQSLSAVVSNPPDAEDDLLASQGQPLNSKGLTVVGQASASQEGGSLYYALVEAARTVAPAAMLTGAAMYIDKKTRRSRSKGSRSRRAASRKGAQKLRRQSYGIRM